MRRLPALVLAIAFACAACTSGSEEPSRTAPEELTFASLQLDWPEAQGRLDPPALPAAPEGFDAKLLERMAKTLTAWAQQTTVDPDGWGSNDPLSELRTILPKEAAGTLEEQVRPEVSPNLAVANVFGDDVTVVGSPMVTSAWRVATEEDPADETFVRLELQTRVAYEVRLGDGDTRVIGVLRVQGLTAYPDTTDDYGTVGGWQEFGAGDCALAIDDALVPDSDPAQARKDLEAFIRIGNSSKVEMPELPVQEKVDDEYLQRCRDGQV
ncbi:hypothetical protein [Aeromicrobium sp. NPDC092404]|uniref:hypothetical protein n=1 Tax=Aeromicrobium sp. NPDC092404 TaxID=3154976 RepID=UPI003422CCA6